MKNTFTYQPPIGSEKFLSEWNKAIQQEINKWKLVKGKWIKDGSRL